MLIKHKIENAIFHWYSGSLNLIDQIVENGYYFSINSAMLKSIKGQKIISRIPLNCILTESDYPYIQIDNKNSLEIILEYLSKIYNKSIKEIEIKIDENFKKIINTIK